jgi:hypothetical protein
VLGPASVGQARGEVRARVDLGWGRVVSKPVGLVGFACLSCPADLMGAAARPTQRLR